MKKLNEIGTFNQYVLLFSTPWLKPGLTKFVMVVALEYEFSNEEEFKQFIENLFCAITEKNKNAIEMGYECPIILCSSAIRRDLKNLIKNNFSNHVMSYKEIDKHYKVKEIAVISEINI